MQRVARSLGLNARMIGLASVVYAGTALAQESPIDPTPNAESSATSLPESPSQSPAAATPAPAAALPNSPTPATPSAPATAAFPLEPAAAEAAPRAASTPTPGATSGATSSAPSSRRAQRSALADSRPFGDSSAGPAPLESEATQPQDGDTRVDSAGGVLGPIRLGPYVGVGLPDLLNFGGIIKLTRYLGAGLNIGVIPTVHIAYYGEATLSFREYDVFGRIHPFGGGFFVGAGVGYATVKGTKKETFDTTAYAAVLPSSLAVPNPVVYEANGRVKTMILTPQIGYFYTTDIGFSIGFDLGAQVPLAPSKIDVQSQVPLPAGTPDVLVSEVRTQLLEPSNAQVKDTLQSIARTPIPTFNFRIGWLL